MKNRNGSLKLSHVSLRAIQAILTVVSFLPIIFCLVFFIRSSYNYSVSSREDNIRSAVNASTDTLGNEIETIYRNSVILLRNSELQYMLQQEVSNVTMDSLLRSKQQIIPFIEIVNDVPFVEDTKIYVKAEKAYLTDGVIFKGLSEIEGQAWFKSFMPSYVKSKWFYEAGEGIFYAVKVLSANNYNNVEAVVKISHSSDRMEQILSGTLLYSGEFTGLYSTNNEYIAGEWSQIDGTDEKVLSKQSQTSAFLEEHLLEMTEGTAEYDDYIIYVKHLSGIDLKIVSIVPKSSFSMYQGIDSIYVPLLILAVIMALVLILNLCFTDMLTQKIKKVSAYVHTASDHQNVKLIPPFKVNDELQDLANSYNSMAEELHLSMERVYLQGLSKRNSDLMALQAQINPHFLYNTLELIDAYAYENRPDIVEDIVKRLANFYKFSLNSGSNLYSLWKEVKLVEAYYGIQKIRWQDSLEMSVDIPEELMQCQIPPLTLQPLVENSILHGIREHNLSGHISIRAEKTDNAVCIIVADDGAGMNRSLVDELNLEMKGLDEGIVSGNHYGIRNSNQRLKIIFGIEYGIQIVSNENEGTVVYVKIPPS